MTPGGNEIKITTEIYRNINKSRNKSKQWNKNKTKKTRWNMNK